MAHKGDQNIIFLYLEWYFFDVPKEILKGWRNFLLFILNFFSIPQLLKTLFAHWHRYEWKYPKYFDIAKYAEAFVSNLISRVLGAIVRFIFIIIGIIFEALALLIGFAVFAGWLILPLILFALLMYSLGII